MPEPPLPPPAEPPAVAAAPPPVPPVPSNMPSELREFLSDLETWASANRRDAKVDLFAFWMLKGPALATSAFSSLFTAWNLKTLGAVLAATAALCVAIDAIRPRGQLRSAHMRAVYGIRNLEHSIKTKWNIGKLNGEADGPVAARVLEFGNEEREKISSELEAAESSLAKPSGGQ